MTKQAIYDYRVEGKADRDVECQNAHPATTDAKEVSLCVGNRWC